MLPGEGVQQRQHCMAAPRQHTAEGRQSSAAQFSHGSRASNRETLPENIIVKIISSDCRSFGKQSFIYLFYTSKYSQQRYLVISLSFNFFGLHIQIKTIRKYPIEVRNVLLDNKSGHVLCYCCRGPLEPTESLQVILGHPNKTDLT